MSEPWLPLRVLHDFEPASGSDNMRIDEELLDEAVASGQSTLRFYQWEEPTISLGYFQKDVAAVPPELQQLPVVRRLSGGGAILHDLELTYSLSVSRDHPWARGPSAIYGHVHAVLIACLAELGLSCDFRGDAESDPDNKSFLCFSRSDANDIVVGSDKVIGSAQRRRRGAILQHGSILLRSSTHAPDFPGVYDLGAIDKGVVQLAARIDHGVNIAFNTAGQVVM